MNASIAFIGGGNMTRAIAGGLVDGGVDARRLRVAEPQAEARSALADLLPGATISDDNARVVDGADCLVLSVKPQVLPAVCRALSGAVQTGRPLVVSIAAGVRSADIDAWLGGGLAVVRVMPNQPALVRQGVAGLYANERSTDADRELARSIMAAVGDVVLLDAEDAIDAVTAISGSGPAYFFLLIDMLVQTAIDFGLPANAARELAIGTARGSAALAATSDVDMETLISRVRSPGGTTAAALDELDGADVRAIFAAALTAARDRAFELADQAHQDNPE